METKTITIRISAAIARIFEAASDEQRRKLEALLSLKLSDATRSTRSLEEVMSEISRNAQSRGLTPEILDSVLIEEFWLRNEVHYVLDTNVIVSALLFEKGKLSTSSVAIEICSCCIHSVVYR